ncbi:hypothetical protein MRX96_058001 [Rhipicephalus microplus]
MDDSVRIFSRTAPGLPGVGCPVQPPAKQSFETTGISVVTCVSNRYDTRSWAGGYEEPLSAGSSSLGLPETSQCLQCCGSPQGIYASTVCDCCHLHKCRELSGLSTCVCADATEDFEKRFFKEISVRQDWLIQTCISLQHWLLPAYVRGGYSILDSSRFRLLTPPKALPVVWRKTVNCWSRVLCFAQINAR